MIVGIETNKAQKIDAATIKALVGGDSIPCRRPNLTETA
jgi:phage/plasmid-associated DNA primase